MIFQFWSKAVPSQAMENNISYNIWIGDDIPTLVQDGSELSSLPGKTIYHMICGLVMMFQLWSKAVPSQAVCLGGFPLVRSYSPLRL